MTDAEAIARSLGDELGCEVHRHDSPEFDLLVPRASAMLVVSSSQIQVMLMSMFGRVKRVGLELKDPTSIDAALALARSKRFMMTYRPVVSYVDFI